MYNIGTMPIAIPASDRAICAYGGVVVFNIVIENAAAPANDLILYDNPTTGSGNMIAVVSKSTANGVITVRNKANTGIYVKNVSGWTGTIYLSEG